MNKRDLKNERKIKNIIDCFKEIKNQSYEVIELNQKFSKNKSSEALEENTISCYS